MTPVAVTPVVSDLFIGLISGTSADAIDAALVSFTPELKLLHALAMPYPSSLREEILRLGLGNGQTSLQQIGELDTHIGEQFAAAALKLLEQSGYAAERIRAIGSHGQTLWHAPRAPVPFTLQIGDPNIIAERTGIDTLADFRRRDLAAGGEGAPLAPAFHAAFLRSANENRAVLNLGGIANLTLLPAHGRVLGFDTGPANGLLDVWAELHLGVTVDQDGAFAARGQVHKELLTRCLSDPYFSRPAPKSTGRDYFNLAWLHRNLSGLNIAAEDIQATLLALTARSIADALQREAPATTRVLVCGGGARNPVLMTAIRNALTPITIELTSAYGVDPDFLEAMAFAWLARERIDGRCGNLPEVTGARGKRILGGFFKA